jgi:membrane protein implicated in regulation of membrane protease activity
MIEWLNINILYWHWIVFGLLLIAFELFAPIFVMLWLGIAAVIVGIVDALLPLSFSVDLVFWAVLSAMFLLSWHKFISPKMTYQTLAGLSKEAIVGQTGMVIFFNTEEGRGRLKFPAPIVGNDEWEFIHDGPLENGDKVKVTDISGNSLFVRSAN